MTATPCCWLSFSITPVQAFVGAARTVRDLRVGSALLSYLTGEAIIAGLGLGGTLLFPQVGRADIETARKTGQLSIPNRFLMELPPGVDGAEAAQVCRDAANQAWLRLCDGVHGMLAGKLSSALAGWDAGWDDQVKQFWDIRVHTISASKSDEEAYQALYGQPSVGPWRRQWGLVTAAERMSRQVRYYRGDGGQGRPKCSMMGELEQMGPMGGAAGWDAQRDFWATARHRFLERGLRLDEHDRLCAVSLVKRFAPTQVMQDLLSPVPDTARVAVEGWLAECRGQGLGDALDSFKAKANALTKALGGEGETPGRYLLDDGLTAESAPEEEQATADAAREMLQARGALLRAARDKNLGRPPRYLAVLMLDGDHIGQWLGGDEQPDQDLSRDHFEDVGARLKSFAAAARLEVEKHHGYPVYTGGDDLLALLPMLEALPCARALHAAFVHHTGHTASMGLVICHYVHDLRDALQRTRLAVEAAKDGGRDALLAWRLLRRSGEETAGVADWDLLARASELQSLYLTGASDRWSYRLAENRPAVEEFGDQEPLRHLIAAFVNRTEGKYQDRTKKAAIALWDQHNAFAADPKRDRLGLQWAGGRLFGAYLDLLSLSAFLARGGE